MELRLSYELKESLPHLESGGMTDRENEELLQAKLVLLEEKHIETSVRNEVYIKRMMSTEEKYVA